MRWRIAVIFLALPLLQRSGWTQLAPAPDAPPASTVTASAPENETEAIKVDVRLVDLFFNVRDKAGNLLPHLTANDCTIAEDNQPQRFKSFSAESSLPLTLGILLDTSGSQLKVLPLEQQAGGAFLEEILRPRDEAFLLSFDVNVDLLHDLTSNAGVLEQALRKAEINTGAGKGTEPAPTAGKLRGTLLYDAVELAAQEVLSRETGRKAIVLLTDGQDEGSNAKLNDAIAAAVRANVMVYVILIADRGFYGKLDESGYGAMKKLTQETGGRLIDGGSDGKKLKAIFQQLNDELRSQYVASYTSTNIRNDGSFRRIQIDCNGEGLKVQARKGYYAPGAQEGRNY